MLQAKARGGNEIAVFTGEMRRQNEIRTDIELHLVTAIRSGSLILHYQPEVDMTTGEVTGVEALVRWPHPNLGLLPPGAFIDVIETTNLAGELGRWVLATGCRQLREWHQKFPDSTPLGLSVNVSPAELITQDFVDHGRQDPRRRRAGRSVPDPGDHREGHRPRHRAGPGHAARAQGDRGQGRHRRLRHRLQLARPAQVAAGRRTQDRPRVRPRPRAETPTTWPSSGPSSAWPARSGWTSSPRAWRPSWPRPRWSRWAAVAPRASSTPSRAAPTTWRTCWR